MTAQNNEILEGSIWKSILKFFFPIVIGSFFQQLYNTVDAIVVGKFVGSAALAAVGGTTGSLIALLVNFFVGLSSGATVVLSQVYGARNAEGVERTVHTAAAMALAFGAFLTIVGMAFAPTMLLWMGVQEDVMIYAAPYIRIYFAGMIPSLIYNVGAGLLQAVGDSQKPMLFLIAACVTNIVMDILLTMGLNLGVQGAAFATIASETVSAVLVVRTLLKTGTVYRLQVTKIRFHARTLKEIVRIGFPAGIQSSMFGISNAIVQTAINGFSTATLAGYTAFSKVEVVYWMTSSALGVSTATFVGQNYGAGNMERVRKGINTCLLLYLIVMSLCAGMIYLFGRPLLGMFTNDADVVEIGYDIVQQIVPFFLIYIFVEIFCSAVRGTGDVFVPTLIMMIGICLLRVLWIFFVVPQANTIRTVMWIYPITWIATSSAFAIYYYSGKWKRNKKRKSA